MRPSPCPLPRLVLAAAAAAAVLFAGLIVPAPLRAEEPTKVKVEGNKVRIEQKELLKDPHAEHKAEEPKKSAVKKPAAAEAKVSPEAKAVLAEVTAAYQKVTGLALTGTLTADVKVDGQAQVEKGSFTASFAAPNKFRHQMVDDVTVGSTGERLYAFRPAKNDYKQADAPKARVPAEKIPQPMRDILTGQNVSLMCALVDDAGRFLVEGTAEVSKGADVTVGGAAFTALDFKGANEDYRVLIDPATHLVRQVAVDMRRAIVKTGAENVERFVVTCDYTKSSTAAADVPADAAQYAWAAPDGARDANAAEAEEGEAMALAGKAAPDFTLKDLAGQAVTLADQKGSVVILDFWATWCGPCRQSLPGLNKLHKELSAKGLKTYAVDLEEEKAKVQPVAGQLCPDLTVLLDEKSEVAKQYGVSGIPQTVVIGKDGKVRKVFIGAGNEARIRAVVEKALGE